MYLVSSKTFKKQDPANYGSKRIVVVNRLQWLEKQVLNRGMPGNPLEQENS